MIPNSLDGRTVVVMPSAFLDQIRISRVEEIAASIPAVDKLVGIPVIVSPYMPVGYIAIVHNGEIVGVYTYAD